MTREGREGERKEKRIHCDVFIDNYTMHMFGILKYTLYSPYTWTYRYI